MSEPLIWWCVEHNQQGVLTYEYQVEADECWLVVYGPIESNYKLCRMESRALRGTTEEGN